MYAAVFNLFYLSLIWTYGIYIIAKNTMPLSMLLIGSLIADISMKQVFEMSKDKYIWTAVLLKLLVIPLLIIPFGFFGIRFSVLAVKLYI